LPQLLQQWRQLNSIRQHKTLLMRKKKRQISNLLPSKTNLEINEDKL